MATKYINFVEVMNTIVISPYMGTEAKKERFKSLQAIHAAHAADVVEVVRCGDCIHAGDCDCPIDWPKNGKDFCSFGERREAT